MRKRGVSKPQAVRLSAVPSLVASVSPGALGWIYTFFYNGVYMIPEIILTALVALLLGRVPKIVTKVS